MSRRLRFRRLRLRNWKNFRQADVPLGDRLFLVGANAAGKSNFLDAFRFLRDVARSGGGFESAVRDPRRGGVSGVRCLAARDGRNARPRPPTLTRCGASCPDKF